MTKNRTTREGAIALTVTVVFAVLALPAPAMAYLDPASGSMLLQLVLGGVAGAAVALRLFWRRLVARFRPRQELPSTTEDS